MPSLDALDEAVRAYRTLERRLSIVAALVVAGFVLMWWLEASLYVVVPLLLVIFGAAVVHTKRQSAFPRAVGALHELSSDGLAAAEPREVRTRWWHIDSAFPLIWLTYALAYAYLDGRRLHVVISAITVVVIAVIVGVEAYYNPFMPRRPGVALRLTPDGVELPHARLTLRWAEIDAVWPIPDSTTPHLGLAFHLAKPEVTLVSRRMRRAAARNGGCVFLRANWLRAPLVDLLQTAHAFKRASTSVGDR
ncbi:MAG: hypothetical protein HOU81_27495 [Hamadaea sp.]|uniref:hypothetical protein n=1 Tax=Hamadaea sp. TaxID=2024425 RepID=UPI0017D5F9C8|nr:hypothetical protein [Hamadaea sp.]NUR74572.1 hypothetical protein [Hamadaea sp.]NUT17892.1 hypothetical protein [Hamadaea sp.]